jgi:hypothetical protein
MPFGRLARGFGLTGLVVGILLLSGCQIINPPKVAQGAQGKIAWPKDGDLWIYDLSTRQQMKITGGRGRNRGDLVAGRAAGRVRPVLAQAQRAFEWG